tara:strand:- start:1171 stop:1314 length:144 start_codon:yes stop_codon:yes gene_type:complete
MAWYKCLVSGSKVEFTDKIDIESMKRHQGYELIDTDKLKKKYKPSKK